MAISQGGLDPWAVQLRIGERDARHALGAVLGPLPGQMMQWSSGVLPSRSDNGALLDLLFAVAEGDGLGVQFYPGQCVIDRPYEGPYVCTLDRTGRVQLDDADPSNPRIDLVVARVYDERQGDARTEFVVEPVTGTPGPAPVAPALPPVATPLCEVYVPAGTTQLAASLCVDVRRSAQVRGGIGVVLSGNDPDAPGAYAGHARYRDGTVEAFDGQTWRGTPTTWAAEADEVVVREGVTEVASLTSVTVPDPGWPYRLMVSGSAELTGAGCRADLTIRLDTAEGDVLARAVGPVDSFGWTATPTRTTGVLTGDHTVFLSGERASNYDTGTWSNTRFNAALSVLRLPA